MARGATRVSVNQEQDRGAQGRSHNQPALGALGHRPPLTWPSPAVSQSKPSSSGAAQVQAVSPKRKLWDFLLALRAHVEQLACS